ncbi:hypothetical protein F442_19798 [Phytophthora nicotianae P10297]|uniref:Uncharacterized protein n=1 Tax=Phytophthora nicotianae P10297 TaxID=1317064 RepID=W2Y9C7_PHYNI|nr:hypothetical protein F442_19798 [Phytophthora nicotianae P10297]
METEADLSGIEIDATVVLEYTDGDDEGGNSSLQVEPKQQDVESEVLETEIVVEHTINAPLDVSSGDSEDSLDFGSDSKDDGIGMAAQNRREPVPPKAIFKSIGFYNTLGEAEGALHGFNRFVYTYRTSYQPIESTKHLFGISFFNVAITLAQLFNFQHEEFLPF